MPAADAVLLPLCIGLSLVGVVVLLFAFRRGRRARVAQGLALVLAPVALYLTGLLRLVWNAVVAVVGWASGSVFDLKAWVGFGILAVCVVLWVVGGVLARRGRGAARPATKEAARQPAQRQVSGPRKPAAKPAQDDDMAEIEALLKSRGTQ